MATTKTDEQIAKDKEAVSRMIGAKSAMEAAHRRIALLEEALKTARHDLNTISGPFGKEFFISVYSAKDSGYRPARMTDMASDAMDRITQVL